MSREPGPEDDEVSFHNPCWQSGRKVLADAPQGLVEIRQDVLQVLDAYR